MSKAYRLATARLDGSKSVFIEIDGKLYPLSRVLTVDDSAKLGSAPPEDMMPLIQDWAYWSHTLDDRVNHFTPDESPPIPTDQIDFCPPISAPKKMICIGANYKDHIEEMKIPMLPDYPFSFIKPASNTLRGSGESVKVPSVAEMIDWEAELAAVIGKTARNLSKDNALDYVAGYTNFNDLSARDWIKNRPPVGIDWVRHKCHDGFAPMGPYFQPKEFTGDPQDLPIKLSVNGQTMQDSNTCQMVFGVAEIIEHLSQIMTLEPGDVIATGTPAGVGAGRNTFLKSGDVVEMEIGHLGVLKTPIV